VTYQNAENGFCVIRVKARGHRDLVTVVGHAAAICAGEWITATLGIGGGVDGFCSPAYSLRKPVSPRGPLKLG
jgi:hypothetical protein